MYDRTKRVKLWLNLLFLLVIISLCFFYLRVNPLHIISVTPSFVSYIASNFFPPSLNNFEAYLQVALYTIAFAVVGTYLSAILSLFLGILMSEEIVKNRIIRVTTRIVATFVRTIPVLILASVMMFIFGIGSIGGLLALVLSTTGFLSRSYADSISDIASKKLESFRASGTPTLPLIIHGLIPELMPAWINWTLFTFEISIRSSAVLGMVGAGGMGILIRTHLESRNFNEAATLILVLIAVVLCTEFVTGIIRKRYL